MTKQLSVAIVSAPAGMMGQWVTYPFVYEEATKLAERGLKIHIIGRTFAKPSMKYEVHIHGIESKKNKNLILSLIKNLKNYPPLAYLRNPGKIFIENLYAVNITKLVTRNRLQIIHAHFAYPEGMAALLAKYDTKKPLVVTLHGYDILTDASIKYGSRLSKRYDSIIKKVVNEADRVIVASRATQKEAFKIVKNTEKVILINNAVDIQRFNSYLPSDRIEKRYNVENKNVIFTLRGHVPKNGIEYLIRAARLVVEKRQDVFFIVGSDGPLRQYHETLAKKLGLSNYVTFTGRITEKELIQYYALCNIFVIPSVQEAFGLVATEAMACGKPVIGTDVGGIPDQITHGKNGFLVPPRNPRAIAQKIFYLLENPDVMKKMGQEGRKIAEKNFSLEKRITKIVKIYEELLEE